MTDIAAWFSTPNVAGLEMIAQAGYASVILDAEHGTFDLADLNRAIPLAHALGLRVLVKALAAERAPIQQALDFGADAVVIPHVFGVDHAREVTAFAKLPPRGDRSLAGGRTMGYQGFDDTWAAGQDASTLCLPMIEHPEALDDIDDILALDTVDGVFVGPGDLFARRGAGGHTITAYEQETLIGIARAARRAGKHWMMPAWSEPEQRIAVREGAHTVGIVQEFGALRSALEQSIARFVAIDADEASAAHDLRERTAP